MSVHHHSRGFLPRTPMPAPRRQHIHGRLLPAEAGRKVDRICLAIAGLTGLYFAWQLLRGML